MATRALTFNPKNIDGSLYVDSTIQTQSTVLNGSIIANTSVLNGGGGLGVGYNNVNIPANSNYGTTQFNSSSNIYTITDTNNSIINIFPTDSCTIACMSLDSTFGSYSTFSGYDIPSNNGVFLLNDDPHFTSCLNYPSGLHYIQSYLPATTNGLYGVSFMISFKANYNFQGINLYLPTSNVPRYMCILTSVDGINFTDTQGPHLYSGSGGEIHTWTFNDDFTTQTQIYKLVFVNSSNTTIDFGGCQFFTIASAFKIGNSSNPHNMIGTSLTWNGVPYPIFNNYQVSDEITTVNTSTNVSIYMPFAISLKNYGSINMPIFTVTVPPVGATIFLDVLRNGSSIYTSGHKPQIVPGGYGGYSTGLIYDSTGTNSSCGLINGGYLRLNRGDVLTLMVTGFSGSGGKGLKFNLWSQLLNS